MQHTHIFPLHHCLSKEKWREQKLFFSQSLTRKSRVTSKRSASLKDSHLFAKKSYKRSRDFAWASLYSPEVQFPGKHLQDRPHSHSQKSGTSTTYKYLETARGLNPATCLTQINCVCLLIIWQVEAKREWELTLNHLFGRVSATECFESGVEFWIFLTTHPTQWNCHNYYRHHN